MTSENPPENAFDPNNPTQEALDRYFEKARQEAGPQEGSIWSDIEAQLTHDRVLAGVCGHTPEFISTYFDNEISPNAAEAVAFEQHLPQCPPCCETLGSWREISYAIATYSTHFADQCTLNVAEQVMARVKTADLNERRRRKWLQPVAGAAVAAVLVAVFFSPQMAQLKTANSLDRLEQNVASIQEESIPAQPAGVGGQVAADAVAPADGPAEGMVLTETKETDAPAKTPAAVDVRAVKKESAVASSLGDDESFSFASSKDNKAKNIPASNLLAENKQKADKTGAKLARAKEENRPEESRQKEQEKRQPEKARLATTRNENANIIAAKPVLAKSIERSNFRDRLDNKYPPASPSLGAAAEADAVMARPVSTGIPGRAGGYGGGFGGGGTGVTAGKVSASSLTAGSRSVSASAAAAPKAMYPASPRPAQQRSGPSAEEYMLKHMHDGYSEDATEVLLHDI